MNHLTLVIVGLIVGLVLHLLNVFADAMLPPLPGRERTRYGFWYRVMQRLASNSGKLEAALPMLAKELAAEADDGLLSPRIIHRHIEPDPRETFYPAATHSGTITPKETTMSTTNTPATTAASTTAKHSFFVTALLGIAHLFTNIFKGIFSSDQGKQIEDGIVAFIKTDVGQLAVDAVQYASTLVGDSNTLRAAAVAKLEADLKTAGKDLTAFSESVLNLFIEMAFTYVQGTVAALPAAIA
jgi:hypothetical protein